MKTYDEWMTFYPYPCIALASLIASVQEDARASTIEEAAKVCEAYVTADSDFRDDRHYERCAGAIRALAEAGAKP